MPDKKEPFKLSLGPLAAGLRGEVRYLPEAFGGWAVFEHVDGPGPLAAATLVFATAFAMMRLKEYPRDWWGLTDAELLSLCGRGNEASTSQRDSH